MNKKTTRNRERWGAINTLLQRWLAERQRLLQLLCSLSGRIRSSRRRTETQQVLDRFCETLVDYVSAGHFEVYCALMEEGERLGGRRFREAARLYASIVPTTIVALDFNDHYFNGGSGRDLAADLSRLGQVLAERFDHEDALIRQLHMPRRAVA